MLAKDSYARDRVAARDRGFPIQHTGGAHLPVSVVTVLIERGTKADSRKIDHYVIALARARMAEARPFLRSQLLRDGPDWYGEMSMKFHAAVGLAQLGDRDGIEWLVSNTGQHRKTVQHAVPKGVVKARLSSCCTAALGQLAGIRSAADAERIDWKDWAETASQDTQIARRIDLADR